MPPLPLAFQSGTTAVITGAALGIGKAIARRARELEMHTVLIDLPGPDLESATKELHNINNSATIIAMPFSVADSNAMHRAAAEVIEDLGPPALLVNNAVTRAGNRSCLETDDWEAAIKVNFLGVTEGVSAFAPAMISASQPAHIVNVGSKQGITNPPGHPIYNACKSAIKSYTESLQHELRNIPDCQVTAHLLIPGWTTTGHNPPNSGAWKAEQVADRLFAALGLGSFYIICPDNEVTPAMDRKRILWSAGDITDNRPPLSRWHGEFDAEFARFEP